MPRKQLLSKFIKFYYPADLTLDPLSIFQPKPIKIGKCFMDGHQASNFAYHTF